MQRVCDSLATRRGPAAGRPRYLRAVEIRTYVDIAAPPHRVWELITDFAGWDRWNPLLRRVRGRPEVGATVRFTATVGRARLPLTAEVLIVEPERELMWVGPAAPRFLRKVVSGQHWFRLAPSASGTRFDHGEVFYGLAVPPRWDRFEAMARPGYEAMNRALKREAETARA